MDESREYTGVTPESLACMKANMQSKGIMPPEGTVGMIEYMGVSVSFTYLEPETLQFRIVDKPLFIPDELIWGFLEPVVMECLGYQREPTWDVWD